MIMIQRELEEAFYLTEKCASTSIRRALLDVGWERVQSTLPSTYLLPSHWRCYFVTRYPLDRVGSYYRYRVEINGEKRPFDQFVSDGDDLPLSLKYFLGPTAVEYGIALEYEALSEEWGMHFPAIELPLLNVTGGMTIADDATEELIRKKYSHDYDTWYPKGRYEWK